MQNKKNNPPLHLREGGDRPETGIPFTALFKDAFFAALIALILFLHLIGLRTVDQPAGLGLSPQWLSLSLAVGGVFVGRFLFGLLMYVRQRTAPPVLSLKAAGGPALYSRLMLALFFAALILPFTPLASRYVLDVATLILTYMMLAYGLSLVVGMTGLLDLGFVAYYAIGAYSFALLAKGAGIGFWAALPLSMLAAMAVAALLGLAVLRLRGDYYAIVTLGFAEILRLVLLNAVPFTGGPNGITGIPRPGLFGLSFERTPPDGTASFAETMGIPFEPMQRVIFLYLLALVLCAAVFGLVAWLRRRPLGRAFEAVREDERAAEAIGINLTLTKMAATMLAAACGALAGAFFAARQGFISPESFTFTESALVLAIVVLGGAGHLLGVALAALFLVGLPEMFRELQDYRLIAFGAGMVLIMILRPSGLFSRRAPSVRYSHDA